MAFLGMRGTGDWVTDQRPKSWRETILFLYPNGDAPLTAITSKLRSEKVDDPEFNWWTKTLPTQAGPVTGVYTDSALSSAYTSGGTADDVLYIKMAAADAQQCRPGHTVMLRKSDDYRYDTRAKVTARTINGASSYLTVSLLHDANATYDLDSVDRFIIIGNTNAEGATMPQAVSYDPVKHYNYTQIFRTSLSLTRTAMRTRLRTAAQYEESKREALELHSIEIEKAILWGKKREWVGDNGKPERATDGLITVIKENEPNNVDNFALNADYSGSSWLQKGEEWLDTMLEQLSRYGKDTKLALCGSGALLALNQLAKAGGHINLNPMTTSYGLKVIEWVTPALTIYLKRHPLFSYEPTERNSMLILEPDLLQTRFVDDTFFKPDDSVTRNTNNSKDSKDEEFLSELGLEYHHTPAFGYLSGVGLDSAV